MSIVEGKAAGGSNYRDLITFARGHTGHDPCHAVEMS